MYRAGRQQNSARIWKHSNVSPHNEQCHSFLCIGMNFSPRTNMYSIKCFYNCNFKHEVRWHKIDYVQCFECLCRTVPGLSRKMVWPIFLRLRGKLKFQFLLKLWIAWLIISPIHGIFVSWTCHNVFQVIVSPFHIWCPEIVALVCWYFTAMKNVYPDTELFRVSSMPSQATA